MYNPSSDSSISNMTVFRFEWGTVCTLTSSGQNYQILSIVDYCTAGPQVYP